MFSQPVHWNQQDHSSSIPAAGRIAKHLDKESAFRQGSDGDTAVVLEKWGVSAPWDHCHLPWDPLGVALGLWILSAKCKKKSGFTGKCPLFSCQRALGSLLFHYPLPGNCHHNLKGLYPPDDSMRGRGTLEKAGTIWRTPPPRAGGTTPLGVYRSLQGTLPACVTNIG